MALASVYVQKAQKESGTNAYYWDGIRSSLYCTLFEGITFHANSLLLQLFFAHLIGSEPEEYWTAVIYKAKALQGFDFTAGNTKVDQEKSIHAKNRRRNDSQNAVPRPIPGQKEH